MLLPKKKLSFFIVIAFISLAVSAILYHVYKPQETSYLRKIAWEIMYPLENLTRSSYLSIYDSWQRYLLLIRIKEENHKLRSLNEELRGQVLQYSTENRELALEAARLQKLMAFKDTFHYATLAAQVIGRDKLSPSRIIVINRGSNHGIKAGMPVLVEDGLVGRITETSWNISRVMLITDQMSRIDAVVQESRQQCILYGTGGEKFLLKFVPQNEDVPIGSAVITSGLCGSFPKGLLLGYIEKTDMSGKDLFQEISVRPAVHFDKLEELLILTSPRGGRK